MPEVEVFIGVTVKNDDGTTEKHSLSGVVKKTDRPIPAVAATGMKTLKEILTQMREQS
jgi:hypothetical protein